MKQLAPILEAMFEADQHYIYYGPRDVWDILARANADWLKAYIKTYGWPTIPEVGDRAAQAAWIIIQHADHDVAFQRRGYKLMLTAWKQQHTNVKRSLIATLEDRININSGKLQRFGTQWDRNADGKLYPQPIADINTLAALRAEWELIPFDDIVQQNKAL